MSILPPNDFPRKHKRCPNCGETKAADAFYRNRARYDGLDARCKECRVAARYAEVARDKAYHLSRYHQNAEFRKAQVAARQRKNRLFLWQYKAERGCSRCSERHPACLDFHHRDPLTKFSAGKPPKGKAAGRNPGVHPGWSIKRMLAEIAKCDLLCANCHRKEHFQKVIDERMAAGSDTDADELSLF